VRPQPPPVRDRRLGRRRRRTTGLIVVHKVAPRCSAPGREASASAGRENCAPMVLSAARRPLLCQRRNVEEVHSRNPNVTITASGERPLLGVRRRQCPFLTRLCPPGAARVYHGGSRQRSRYERR
jgi:hypothetical protein